MFFAKVFFGMVNHPSLFLALLMLRYLPIMKASRGNSTFFFVGTATAGASITYLFPGTWIYKTCDPYNRGH